MFLIYSILYTIVLVVLFMPQYLKRPPELRKKWLREKFGFYGLQYSTFDSRPVWVHAVSVGEVQAAVPLLKKIKAAHPELPVILSTITDTGRKVAEQKAPEGTRVVYLPFDLGFILKRCLAGVRPGLFVIIETELWPNIIRIASRSKIPVILLNGRISEKSVKGYRKISFFMKRVFDHITFFCMQSHQDAQRIKSLGADAGKVMVSGNFKFDIEIRPVVPAWLSEIKGPVLVAGSTHRGEEEIIIDAWRDNIPHFPGLKLIIAPRHPERFREAEEAVRKSDMRYVKRSGFGSDSNGHETVEFDILLLDSVGELMPVYSIADIAIMGKSFKGSGGQNPLEPAFWGKPIICGPHMENFPFMKEFLTEGAAFEVSPTGLAKKIKELLLRPEKTKAAGEKARALYLKNSGAIDRSMKLVETLLRNSQ